MLLHLERRDLRRFSRDCVAGIACAPPHTHSHHPTRSPLNRIRCWPSHQGVLVHGRNLSRRKTCQDIISYLHVSKSVITGSPQIGRGAFLFQQKWRLLWDGKEMRGRKRSWGMTLRRSDKQTWFIRFHALLKREALAEGDRLSGQSSPEKLDVATRCHVFQANSQPPFKFYQGNSTSALQDGWQEMLFLFIDCLNWFLFAAALTWNIAGVACFTASKLM